MQKDKKRKHNKRKFKKERRIGSDRRTRHFTSDLVSCAASLFAVYVTRGFVAPIRCSNQHEQMPAKGLSSPEHFAHDECREFVTLNSSHQSRTSWQRNLPRASQISRVREYEVDFFSLHSLRAHIGEASKGKGILTSGYKANPLHLS